MIITKIFMVQSWYTKQGRIYVISTHKQLIKQFGEYLLQREIETVVLGTYYREIMRCPGW